MAMRPVSRLIVFALLLGTVVYLQGQSQLPVGTAAGAGAGPQATRNFGSENQSRARGNSSPPLIAPVSGTQLLSDGAIRIQASEPLEIAAEVLQRKLGVPISYESPIWEFAGDTAHASDLKTLGAVDPAGTGRVIARPGILDLKINQVTGSLKSADIIALIQDVIDQHHNNHNAGDFRVISFGDREFSIVPDRAANTEGKLEPRSSPLDARISIPYGELSLMDALALILKPLKITPIVTFRDPQLPRVSVGAVDEVARDVLSRSMRHSGLGKLSWHLFYDPQAKSYIFRFVGVETETPDGLQTVRWP